jgi:pentatricopeptide repeat protein
MQDEMEEAFEVSAELKAVLLESIAQCERGETVSAEQLFQEMRDRESAARIVPSAKPA